MRVYRGKEDRLNGLIAGAVAGLAILCEKQEKRVDIGQQLFVRYALAIVEGGRINHWMLTVYQELCKVFIMREKQEIYCTLRTAMLYYLDSHVHRFSMLIP